MTSKEALENIVINFDNMGMICSNLCYEEFYCKDLHFKEIFKTEYESILRDLERLEKLEKENQDLKELYDLQSQLNLHRCKSIKELYEKNLKLEDENSKLKKVIEILADKKVSQFLIVMSESVDRYNAVMGKNYILTQQEYELLKEYL